MIEKSEVAQVTGLPVRKGKKPRAKPASFSGECRAVYTAMPKALRTYLSPLLQYASDREIAPGQIDDQAIGQYRDALARWGVKDPAPFIACLVRDWNRLRSIEGLDHLQPLAPPVGKRAAATAVRSQVLSSRLREELDEYFGTALPQESPRAHTLYNARKRVERLAEAVVATGHAVGSVADLADVHALSSAVDALYPNIHRSKARDLALQAVENVLAASGQAAGLAKIVRKVRFRHRQAGIDLPARAKAQVSHFTMSTVLAVIDAAVAELDRVLAGKPDYDALARARACIAVGLVLWNLCPRSTIEQATFSAVSLPGRPGLTGPHNGATVGLETDLPGGLASGIDRYHAAMQARLGRPPSVLLETGRRQRVSGSALSTGVRRFLADIGHPGMTLQLLRDGANVAFIADNPRLLSWLSDANGFRYAANFAARFRSLIGLTDSQRIEDSYEVCRDDEAGDR